MRVDTQLKPTKVRVAQWAFVAGVLVATASVTRSVANVPNKAVTQQEVARSARKSTDPPGPARGRMGQDLFMAIGRGDLGRLKELLNAGADPNSRNGLEFTPLFIAAASHQEAAVQELLKAGAKPHADSPYGTALSFAASSANLESVKTLLDLGGNVNESRDDGTTVLMAAANTGFPPLVAELIKRKADVNAEDEFGASPLSLAARAGFLPVGAMLVGAGATVDAPDREGQTALMGAAMNGHADFVKLLLSKGANPNARDAKGRTPLILAAGYCDQPEVIKALLSKGANPKAVDKLGRSASALATARAHSASAALLPKPKASELAAAKQTRSPREAAQASLKLMQHSMMQFSRTANCVSCHHEGLGRMATGAAAKHGLALDPAVQKMQMGRLKGMMAAMQPLHEQALKNEEVMKQVPLIEINEVSSTDTWFLAGMAANNQPRDASTEAMAMVLARQQIPDGSWIFGGPRAPMQSSYFTFTALSVKALRDYAPKSSAAEVQERIAKAKNWLAATPAKDTEDKASKLMGLAWAGASAEEIAKAAADLKSSQAKNGGWAQLSTTHTDAYATGLSLYALSQSGMAANDPVYKRGVQFLLRTQDEDGSWFVNKRTQPGNNFFGAGFPHGESQYSSFNGTSWATMALVQTLPKAAKASK